MTQKPAKSVKPAAGVTAAKKANSETAAKPATPAGRTATSRTSRTSTRKPPTHDDVSERAYFLHLEQGDSDPVANWLRAERELASA